MSALAERPAPAGAHVRKLARLPPAWLLTAALGLAYVLAAPPSTDLAAAAYRSDLFSRVGLTLWDNSWYGGHHLLAYSLLAPALGALLGPQLLAALSMTAATALFAALIDGLFPRGATRLAAGWFALGAAIGLLANRVPFDLGLALGMAALLAARRGRFRAALALAPLCSLASPVAGAFLALACCAWALAGGGTARRRALALLLAALAPILLLALAFPEGGSQPFVPSAFYPALAGVLGIAALVPTEQRALRIGTLLYAAAMTASYLLPTAMGGNADRLGALLAGPLVACLLAGRSRIGRRPWLLLALAPVLLYWQANAPIADFLSAAEDPAVHSSYYAALLGELRALRLGYGGRPARLEVVPTVDHWEARWVAPHVMLARGWERQLDRYRNPLFYDTRGAVERFARRNRGVGPALVGYRAWLDAQAVSYVALPDAPLDYSGRGEARLLASGAVPYLREVWRSRHWRLFAVQDPTPLAQPPATLASLSTDSFTLRVPSAGTFAVRVRFTPYWALVAGHGCVAQGPGGWTSVRARAAGSVRVAISFSPERVLAHGARCR